MATRFRKSINLGPLRINMSKSGIGYSIGTKGYRVTKRADGRVQRTVSIPGTGISHVSTSSGPHGATPTAHETPEKISPVQNSGFASLKPSDEYMKKAAAASKKNTSTRTPMWQYLLCAALVALLVWMYIGGMKLQ